MPAVIAVEHLSKSYQLGQIGTGTLTYDLQVWWARKRGKPNPLLRIGEADQGKPGGGRAGTSPDGEKIWALKDVSFTVDQGEVLGIIGRNGAGKSTLLKVLSRITAPTSGKVKVKGRVASLLEVGTGFHPDLTGRENAYLNGAILGMSRKEIERKFDEIVDFAEIERFIDTPVKRYSSGMYVRLAFAVAAHLEPEILLVDEVLAVGDAAFQKKCLGKMGEVAREGRTVLFVSHNMVAANNLCSKCAWIDNGRVNSLGATSTVIQDYLDYYQPNGESGEIDLRGRTERYGNGQARVQFARILPSEGSVSTSTLRTKPFAVELELESLTNNELVISAAVVNGLGMNVLHLSQYDCLGAVDVRAKGHYKIGFSIASLPLFSGKYSLTIGIHTASGMHPVDVVQNSLWFSVGEPLDSPRPIETRSDGFLCWAPSTWSCVYLDR